MLSFQILGDESKRSQYDRYGMAGDAFGQGGGGQGFRGSAGENFQGQVPNCLEFQRPFVSY